MQIMAGNDTGIVPAHEDLCGKGNLQGKEADSYNREAANEAMTPALLGHTATAEIMLIQALYKIDNTVQFRN